jgi:hypothetical protein
MHLVVCMHEHFDLIINSFKFKCEIYQVFIDPFQEIMMNAKCNLWVMDLKHSKSMISFMCKCWWFKRCEKTYQDVQV